MGGETVPLLPLPGQYGTAWGGGEAQGAGLWLQGKVNSGLSPLPMLCYQFSFTSFISMLFTDLFPLVLLHSIKLIPAEVLVSPEALDTFYC